MEGLIKKKLNALAQIARIDGQFADAEKQVLSEIAAQYGKEDSELKEIIDNPKPIEDIEDISEYHKLEFMFVAIKIMRADGLIHESEVEFCKMLALKMRLEPSIVDDFSTVEHFNFDEFMENGKKYVY